MKFDSRYIRSTPGLLKLFSLIFIYLDFIFCRFTGIDGNPIMIPAKVSAESEAPGLGFNMDATWLVFVTIGGFITIHTVMFFFSLFGLGMVSRMEATFLLIGSLLFLICGICMLDGWVPLAESPDSGFPIILGCLLLITGTLVTVDFAFQAKKIMNK